MISSKAYKFHKKNWNGDNKLNTIFYPIIKLTKNLNYMLMRINLCKNTIKKIKKLNNSICNHNMETGWFK